MTPNLNSARQAIQAELSHARQGAAFYTARVEALETALSQLEIVDSDDVVLLDDERKPKSKAGPKQNASRRGRPARKPAEVESSRRQAGSAGAQRAKRGRKANAKGEEGGLPTTGTDFWLELITTEPRSAVDIANAAAAHLGIDSEQKTLVQKLKQRVAPALATLVANQKILHEGAGRQRRYFRGNAQSA